MSYQQHCMLCVLLSLHDPHTLVAVVPLPFSLLDSEE